MIVKDERAVIARCLESVKGWIDYWVIVDTGSTDGTQHLIQDCLKDIPGELFERPWIDFGHNRNEALDLARGKGDYLLFIDADDRLLFSPSFAMPVLDKDYYLVMQQAVHEHASVNHPIILMIRDLPEFKWEGAVHEAILFDSSRSYELLSGVTSEYLHDGKRALDPEKHQKDIRLLEQALQRDPQNSRNVFYLAQTYLGAGQYASALSAYEKRIEMGGRRDEIYHCMLGIGVLQKILGVSSFIQTFCDAYLFRPTRAESLYELSRHYLETDNCFLGYLVAELAVSIPPPQDLFVQPWIYEWGALENFALSALGLGEEKLATAALNQLLSLPELPLDRRQKLESCVPRSEKNKKKKTVCLNMIVKDESRVIQRCLDSVKNLIDYWVIVDTGSTDGTQRIVQDYLHDIPGELHERPWVNFGHNRNEALALARNKCDYILFIDADDRLVFAEDFSMPDLDKDYYILMQKVTKETASVLNPIILLIQDHPDFYWEGVLHEAICYKNAKKGGLLHGVINEYLHDGNRSKDPFSYAKDIQILLKAQENNPDDTRIVFYLGQTYRAAGDFVSSLSSYEKRIAMGGDKGEIYLSMHSAALLQRALQYDPDVFMKTLADAYIYRPLRIEPLYELAGYLYKSGNYFLSYLVSQYALSTHPHPPADILVQPWMYEWGACLQFYLSAFKIEEYKDAYEALQNLLEEPNFPVRLKDENLPNIVKLEHLLGNAI